LFREQLAVERRRRAVLSNGAENHHEPSSSSDLDENDRQSLIARFSSVESLWLCGCELTGLPLLLLQPSVAPWQSLREARLSGNRLGRFPWQLGACVQLRLLNLSRNQIRGQPDSDERSAAPLGFPVLEQLVLDQNPLRTVPARIGNLLALRHLSLQNCELVDCWGRRSLTRESAERILMGHC
jgi:Leucine-rich repeat (LRR) protein